MNEPIRVAIIHDVFIEWGGAERVLAVLLRMFPQTDVFVPLIDRRGMTELKKKTRGRIVTSKFNHLPLIHPASILLKPLLYLYWEQLDLTMYDLVISSSHSFSAKSVITSPKTLHISYIHTPPRYLYAEVNETQIIKKLVFRWLFSPLLSWLRVRDFIGAQRPDVLIANSKTVQARIWKYYRRKSTVIYPPITLPRAPHKTNRPRKYFLCLSRLAKRKGIDLVIQACKELKEPLVVVGEGADEKYFRSIAGPTIDFRGYVPDEQLPQLYAGARALLYPSLDEDFGLVAVEAMAYGIPVIGHDSGGTAETVVDGATGILFQEYSVNGLVKAIKRFERTNILSQACRNRAILFSQERFIEQFLQVVKEALTRRVK